MMISKKHLLDIIENLKEITAYMQDYSRRLHNLEAQVDSLWQEVNEHLPEPTKESRKPDKLI